MLASSLIWLLAFIVGGQFLLFGLDGFFHFLPPPPAPEALKKYVMTLDQARYLLITVKTLEITAGLGCLWPSTRLLSLLLLAPVIYNVMALHLVFNRRKAWIVGVQTVLPYLLLLVSEKDKLERVLADILQLT